MRKNQVKASKNSNKSAKAGQIRIISGRYRGRKLPVLSSPGLRPTTDRVKETVFNWLMPYLHDAVVLDCFAGSGSLGIEALSRQAQHVTLIEMDKAGAKQIKQNLIQLDADNADVFQADCIHWLKQTNKRFDLVFIDPPFRQSLVSACCEQLEKQDVLTESAIIYVESEAEMTTGEIPAHWQLLKEKVAGQVAYRLYERTPT